MATHLEAEQRNEVSRKEARDLLGRRSDRVVQ
jgi:hypothetical protein